MIKKAVLPVVIILLAIAVFVGLKLTKPQATVAAKQEKRWLVNAVEAKYQTVSPELTIYGRVETPRNAELKAALAADVLEVLVLEGAEVTAGQLLIRLDPTDAELTKQQRQADLDEISAQIQSENQRYARDKALVDHQKELLTLAERAVQRANKLEQSKLAAKSTLDDALAAKEQQLLSLLQLQHDIDEHPARLAQLQAKQTRAKALLEQAEVDLQRTEIRAPFTGRVASLNVALGDRVRAGDSLLNVYDLEHLEVRAQIPGRYITEVKTLIAQGYPLTATAKVDGQALDFKLQRLSGEVQTDSGGLDGLFDIQQTAHNLALGTFVELHLKLAAENDILALPFTALYGLDRVYKIEDGYLKSVQITRVGEASIEGEKRLLARSQDIQPGDMVAATQLPNAITGLPVEVSGD